MAAGSIPPIRLLKILIVEGRDEENFFTAGLTRHLGILDVQVLAVGGKTLLPGSLKVLRNDPAFPNVQALGVVRDADLAAPGARTPAAESAFVSVRAALTAPGVQLPCPAGHGQFAAGVPKVGVFIMPNGVDEGMLETLCVAAVAASPGYPCLDEYFACLQRQGVASNNLHKARAHAWLASCPEPDRRVGEGALAGYWPFTSPVFGPLWTFIQGL
jgi:hypothetical protein